jgi:hypothetical protein
MKSHNIRAELSYMEKRASLLSGFFHIRAKSGTFIPV